MDRTGQFFDFILANKVKGDLELELNTPDGKNLVTEKIEMDFQGMQITNQDGEENNIDEFYAIDAVD